MEAIILAGGLGSRLKSEVNGLPKSMAPVNEKPFLDYVFNYLLKGGITRSVLATGYLHHKIEEYYGTRFKGMEIDYSVETEPLGTGGAIKQALSQVKRDYALIMNGDTFFPVSIDRLCRSYEETQADLLVALKAMENTSRYGVVKFEGTRIRTFEEKQSCSSGYINAGVYMASANLFDRYRFGKKFSFEEDLLKPYVGKLNMHAYISEAYFIDIGIPEDYDRAQIDMIDYE